MLKWNKISDANGYKVLKKSSDEDVWKEIGSVTGNIFMDSDVYDQSSYLYAVKPYIEVEDDFGLVCQETNEIGVQMAELEKPIIRKDETTETPGTPQKPTQSSENDKKPSSGGQTETNVPKTTLKNQKIFYKRVKSYKAKQLKKKQVKFSLKARTTGDGKLTYKISKYPKKCKKYISVSNKGIVTLKKGIKKGTYGITVTASKTKKYTKAQKSIIIKIK